MLPWGPPDIKFSVERQKSPFGDIENLTKLTHGPIPPYHRGRVELYCWPDLPTSRETTTKPIGTVTTWNAKLPSWPQWLLPSSTPAWRSRSKPFKLAGMPPGPDGTAWFAGKSHFLHSFRVYLASRKCFNPSASRSRIPASLGPVRYALI